MRTALTTVLLALLFMLPAFGAARADDYFKKAFMPDGADNKSNQIYPADDFDDVIFTREYFYSLEEGMQQMDRPGSGSWNNEMELEYVPPPPDGGAAPDTE
ncbi:MAG TPA: hypothetical protein PKC29_14590 [Thermodesulfobacteriota bacterium]|nr:hypothetical protein [Thermodesulfobacteriota bacterium]